MAADSGTRHPVARPFSEVVRWLRVGLAGLAFLGFWVGASLSAIIVLPLCLLVYCRLPRFERAAACQRWIQHTFILLHDYLRWCGLLHFDPRAVDGSTPAAGFVLVANHPTLIDVAALSAVFGRLSCVAKTPLFRSPIIGNILHACAYLDGGGGDPFAGALVVDQAIERLAGAMPVLIFPEGTRSPAGGLHSFKRGAFEIACRANVPVLPVMIRCSPLALEKGRPWYDIPRQTARFTVTPMPELRPEDFGHDSTIMTAACENRFRVALGLETGASDQAKLERHA